MATNPGTKLKGVKLGIAQLDQIVKGNPITKGANTFVADLNTIYLVSDSEVVITKSEFQALTAIDPRKTYYIIEG